MKEIFNSTTKFVLVIVIIAIILLAFFGKEVGEPLKTIAYMVVSFYFGKTTTFANNEKIKN